jgi:3-dehydroquinate synthase
MKTQFHFSSVQNIAELVSADNCIVVTDKNILANYGALLEPYRKIVLHPGEEEKSFETLNNVIDHLVQLEADKTTTLVGIGGGVISDLTGFAASIYMRGIPFGFVPTTLLAQVDASIGGKNGVNFNDFKNLIGVINQPDFLLVDTNFLNTLSETEYISGLAEIVKYGMIYDKELFHLIREHAVDMLKKDKSLLETVIRRCVEIKKTIVEKDEFETGERKILNFGHTIGHAIERIENIPHGFAVSIGMVAASRLSEANAGLDPAVTKQLTDLLVKFGLPVISKTDADIILSNLKMDKKKRGGVIDFILLKDIGQPVIMPIKPDAILSFQQM